MMPEHSLYKNFIDAITHVMYQSQNTKYNSMSPVDFASTVSPKILAKRPPKYMCLGGSTVIMKLLQWLPRQWALSLIWRILSKAKP